MSTARTRAYRRLGFRPDLEGMRAVAVLLVLVYHAGAPFLPGGYIGVDVFFVLSGFLITNHLLHELSTTGRLRIGAFYARRARRLLPASLTVILATAVVVVLWAPPRLADAIMVDARAAVAFVPNFLFAARNTDYLAEDSTSPLLHYWSLGVEEQFYLLWPVLLLGLWLTARARARVIVAVIIGASVLSLTASVVLTGISEPWAYFAPWTRAWELGVGALVAALRLHERSWSRPLATAGTWVGIGAIVGAALVFDGSTPFPGSAALIPVIGTALVMVLAPASSRRGAAFVLDRPPMRFLGRISYVLYLVHWPLLTLPVVLSPLGEPLPPEQAFLLAAAAVPVAWVIHRTIERPMLEWKSVTTSGPRPILVGAALALVSALALIQVGAAAVAAKPLASGSTVEQPRPIRTPTPATPTPVTPVFTNVVPANLEPSLANAAGDLPRIYADGCHLGLDISTPAECVYGDGSSDRSIVLFGDSHAAQWFPALEIFAEEQGYRLVSHTKSSCPPFSVEIINNGVVDTGCAAWRESVIRGLEFDPPEVVVMAGFAHYDEYGSPGLTAATWADGIAAVVPRLAGSSDVIAIDDTPRFPRTPALCLSASLLDAGRCSVEVSSAIDDTWASAQQEAVEDAGGRTLSLTPWLCDDAVCGVVIGNLLVYRDEHHIATRIAALLEPVVTAALLEGRF